MTGFRRAGERVIHEGRIWRLVVAEFESPEGERFSRDIVRSPGAVAVVPLFFDADGVPVVVLVEQYRPPFENTVIEAPAGMRDIDGEPPEETAVRELAEEAGLRAGRLDPLIEILPSPGLTDSVTTIYLATDCTAVDRDLQGPEERHMQVLQLPLDEALRMIDDGVIRDAKTVAGLLATNRRLAGADRA